MQKGEFVNMNFQRFSFIVRLGPIKTCTLDVCENDILCSFTFIFEF